MEGTIFIDDTIDMPEMEGDKVDWYLCYHDTNICAYSQGIVKKMEDDHQLDRATRIDFDITGANKIKYETYYGKIRRRSNQAAYTGKTISLSGINDPQVVIGYHTEGSTQVSLYNGSRTTRYSVNGNGVRTIDYSGNSLRVSVSGSSKATIVIIVRAG